MSQMFSTVAIFTKFPSSTVLSLGHLCLQNSHALSSDGHHRTTRLCRRNFSEEIRKRHYLIQWWVITHSSCCCSTLLVWLCHVTSEHTMTGCVFVHNSFVSSVLQSMNKMHLVRLQCSKQNDKNKENIPDSYQYIM